MKQDKQEMRERLKTIKKGIEKMITEGKLAEARAAIGELERVVPNDVELYSMKAVIEMIDGNLEEGERILRQGLVIDSYNCDLLYNLAYLYEMQGNYLQAIYYYQEAVNYCKDDNLLQELKDKINLLQKEHKISLEEVRSRKKIVFFSKGDDKFLGDIIRELSKEYDTRKVTITSKEDLKLIEQCMRWADISWFEWCDELIGYGSRLDIAKKKKIICRIHGYEVYTNFIKEVEWKNVDHLIIVAPHIKRLFEENTTSIYKGNLKVSLVYCGINIEKYPLNIKQKGYNIGYLGYINFKKNIPLTLDIFKKLHDIDSRYNLYIAGEFQDARTLSYLKYFIKEHKLQKSFHFDGWLNEEQKIKWFKKIDYMLISSIDEGLCFAAAEAMCSGIKPILHNCEGIKDHYDKKYIFNTIDEAVEMITSKEYDSRDYRNYIVNNYSLAGQMEKIKEILNSLEYRNKKSILINKKKTILLTYRSYSGSNTVALYKLMPEWIKDRYDVKLIKENINRDYFKTLAQSDFVVTTHGNYLLNKSEFKLKHQVLDLWHGFPLKAMGYLDKGERNKEVIKNIWENIDYISSYSPLFNELLNKCIRTDINKYIITGAPRNDLLLSANGRENLEKILGVDLSSRKILFYMPTFRLNANSGRFEGETVYNKLFNMVRFNNVKFNDFLRTNKIIFVLKLHPNEEKIMAKVISKDSLSNIYLMTNKDLETKRVELYEILNAADLLITDYSSVYFDFLLLDRPIIFTPSDINKYEKDRGFLLTPYNEWITGPIALNQQELENEIINNLYNSKTYYDKRKSILNRVHKYHDSKSAERVWNFIDLRLNS